MRPTRRHQYITAQAFPSGLQFENLAMLKFRGCEHFRQRIVLSCLSGRPIRIDDIRSEDEAPGLKGFEASLLRLTEKVSNGCVVEINETGAAGRIQVAFP